MKNKLRVYKSSIAIVVGGLLLLFSGVTYGIPPTPSTFSGGTVTGATYFAAGPVFNIVAYGAATSNTAAQNDTAIQAALTAYHAAGGGIFKIPVGAFKYATGIILADSDVIEGDGALSILDFQPTVNNSIGISATNLYNIRLANFTLKNSQASSKADYGIKLTNIIHADLSFLDINGYWLNVATPAKGFNIAGLGIVSLTTGLGNLYGVSLNSVRILSTIGDGINVSGTSTGTFGINDSVFNENDGYCINISSGQIQNTIHIKNSVLEAGYLGLISSTGLLASSIIGCQLGSATAVTPIAFVGTVGDPSSTLGLTIIGNTLAQGTADFAITFNAYHAVGGLNISNNWIQGTSGKKILQINQSGYEIVVANNIYNGFGTNNVETLVDLGSYYVYGAWMQDQTHTVYKSNLSNGAVDPPFCLGDVCLSRTASNTFQIGTNAATASAQTIKGPDSSTALAKGGNIGIQGGDPGAGGAYGDVLLAPTSGGITLGNATGPVVLTFSVTGTDPTLTVAAGSFMVPASTYLNWGTTAGTSGYGLRDNSGVMESKDSGGSWEPIRSVPIAIAANTVDIITVDYTPNVTLTDMRIVAFVALGANTSTTPSFNPDGLGAHTIVRYGGQALVAGDIPAALAVCLVQYNLANTRWELLNPAQPSPSLSGTFTFSNGATPGSIYFQEGSGGGTDKVQVIGPATVNAGGRVQTLKDETGNICTDGSVCTGYAPLVSPSFTTPILGAATATTLYASGVVDGLASIISTVTSAGYTISSSTSKSAYVYASPVAAAAAFAFTLPAAAAGLQYCIDLDTAKTGIMTITAGVNDYIDLAGVNGASAGHIHNAAGAGAGVCLVGVKQYQWKAYTHGTPAWTAD